MKQDTETNTGWWADRPEREERPSQFASLASKSEYLYEPRKQPSTWKPVAFIVALFLTFAIAISRLI